MKPKVNDILLVRVRSRLEDYKFTLLVNAIEERPGYFYISYVPVNEGGAETKRAEEVCVWGTMKLHDIVPEYGVQEWKIIGHQYNPVASVGRTSMIETRA